METLRHITLSAEAETAPTGFSGRILRPSETGGINMGRRKSLVQLMGLAGACALPSAAHAQVPPAVWLTMPNGAVVYLELARFADEVVIPMLDALSARMWQLATQRGYAHFLTPEGLWAHGRIRDFIARSAWGAALSTYSSNTGNSRSNPSSVYSLVQYLVSFMGAYFVTTGEYMLFVILQDAMGEELARYASSMTAHCALGFSAGFVYPTLTRGIIEMFDNDGRRLENSEFTFTVDTTVDLISRTKASFFQALGGYYWAIDYYFPSRNDDHPYVHHPVDRFTNKGNFTFDQADLYSRRSRGISTYTETALVTRVDNLAISGTCTGYTSATNCSNLAAFRDTQTLTTRTTLPKLI